MLEHFLALPPETQKDIIIVAIILISTIIGFTATFIAWQKGGEYEERLDRLMRQIDEDTLNSKVEKMINHNLEMYDRLNKIKEN